MSSDNTEKDWIAISAAKISRRESLIPSEYRLSKEYLDGHADIAVVNAVRESGLLSEKELIIVYSDGKEILGKLRSRDWTSVEVTTAFIKSSAVAHQVTNCLTEIFYNDALASAEKLDQYFEENGRPIGPLHGLPVSLKDNINVAGYASTTGLVTYAEEIVDKDSVVTQILRELGAVLYVKTNVPVAMMMAESVNNVFGATKNPRNKLLSPGGSSGGEGALIAMRGSVLGVGTDLGGSIRMPSAFNNIYGLRPTSTRFPTWGIRDALPGQEAIPHVIGPLASSIDGLEVFCESILGAQPWDRDPKLTMLPWRKVTLPEKLTFGILWHNNTVQPHPPIARGLELVVKALRAAGHEVIEWAPTLFNEIDTFMGPLFIADGGKTVSSMVTAGNEPWFPSLDFFSKVSDNDQYDLRTSALWKLQAQRSSLQKQYLDLWTSSASLTASGRPVDALITPVSVSAAPQLGKVGSGGYCSVWNLLDYPSATVPVTTVDRDVDVKRTGFTPLTEKDRVANEGYDPEVWHGGPVSVQIVARRFEDEKLLEVLRVVDGLLEWGKE